MSRKDKITPSVVDAVREQTAQAAALAEIDGQHRLADPRLNPATRGHADTLRTEQLTRALDAEHSRLLRRHRVADRRAAEAEETLQAIALARQAASPARSVLALHRGKRLYLRLSLAASLTLSAGSAMGVEAAAQALEAPTGSGYIAEIGLTGLATAVILYRAHLAEHRGELVKGSWQSRWLWALMTIPLLVSVTANLAMLNAVGAFCAISAVAFSVLAYTVADRSSAAMQSRVAEVDEADEAEIRATAMGEDHFAPLVRDGVAEGQEHAEGGGADAVAGAARVAVDELEAWLQDRAVSSEDDGDGDGDGDGGARPRRPVPGDGGGGGAARELPAQPQTRTGAGVGVGAQMAHIATADAEGHIVSVASRQGGHIDSGQDRPAAERVLPATQARLALGAATRVRIAEYLAEHPTASNSQVAAEVGVSVATVKRHRRQIRASGGER